jgi:hypothetical protein
MCPDCGLRAKLTHGNGRIMDAEGKCNYRNNPANCPVLNASLAAIQQVLKQAESQSSK